MKIPCHHENLYLLVVSSMEKLFLFCKATVYYVILCNSYYLYLSIKVYRIDETAFIQKYSYISIPTNVLRTNCRNVTIFQNKCLFVNFVRQLNIIY